MIEAPSIPDRIPHWLTRGSDSDWQVVLWNDDHTPMDHVIHALVEVIPEVDPPQAQELMWTAHFKGSAIVAKGYKERAELIRDQLETFGLTATLEP